jgi:hypothetical protein
MKRLRGGTNQIFATARPYSDPEKAACKLVEIADSVEAVQESRIYIEPVNAPFL